MKTLTILITTKNDTDFDGLPYSYKYAEADIDGVPLVETFTEGNGATDEQIKTNFKSKLTSLGYAWDSAI